MLSFITSNKFKFAEVKLLLPDIVQLSIDLPEIQDIDPQKIIAAKLQAAFNHHDGPFIVEDTSLYLDALNGLPGPFSKWFEKALGDQKLADICQQLGNSNVRTETIIGYAKNADHIQFFSGSINGTIVPPRGDRSFGFNAIFQPDGFDKTFGEMTTDEKNKISMRGIAVKKLRAYLEKV